MDNKDLHSHHIFLFPFKWRFRSERNNSFNDKFDLNNFRKLIQSDLNYKDKKTNDYENSRWKHCPYSLDSLVHFNEYNYFYDFVREIMYDQDENLQIKTSKSNKNFLNHYKFTLSDTSKFCIKVKHKGVEDTDAENTLYETTYKLNIDSILLNIYNTGVGVLSFHLRNFKDFEREKISESGKDTFPFNKLDVLRINQYGRKLFPVQEGIYTSGILDIYCIPTTFFKKSKKVFTQAVF